jgi:hypothetical protein
MLSFLLLPACHLLLMTNDLPNTTSLLVQQQQQQILCKRASPSPYAG